MTDKDSIPQIISLPRSQWVIVNAHIHHSITELEAARETDEWSYAAQVHLESLIRTRDEISAHLNAEVQS